MLPLECGKGHSSCPRATLATTGDQIEQHIQPIGSKTYEQILIGKIVTVEAKLETGQRTLESAVPALAATS